MKPPNSSSSLLNSLIMHSTSTAVRAVPICFGFSITSEHEIFPSPFLSNLSKICHISSFDPVIGEDALNVVSSRFCNNTTYPTDRQSFSPSESPSKQQADSSLSWFWPQNHNSEAESSSTNNVLDR
ncbi:unnamed protein product [Linum trigynum]|uniref:Uncharacterized protein n=1 Tax=Linum trigynum TaxID=586398 RepID=A0AAV2CUX1_9ROSI